MAENTEKNDEIAVIEGQDGSATVDLPENMLLDDQSDGDVVDNKEVSSKKEGLDQDADHPDDDDELREAKRNRRRAKKDLVRKTNQEKDIKLQALQRENEEFRKRLGQLERNTKAEQLTRIDKNIEDAQVRLEYAKMKLSEATSNNDGQAMVEAQTLWQNSQDEMRQLAHIKNQVDQELRKPQQNVEIPDPEIQRNAADWMRRNSWYRPDANDTDTRVAKKIDELMVTQGWDPKDPDYWDELDSRLQKELPHRYNRDNDEETRNVRRPRNVVTSSGREASAAYGGSNRTQFVISPDRVKAMKDAGAWDNPVRKAKMVQEFIKFDRQNGRY
jgi:hypothetical protein